ncbi:MAG: RNA polymerase sigma factor [Acidimicrobiales bacterium]
MAKPVLVGLGRVDDVAAVTGFGAAPAAARDELLVDLFNRDRARLCRLATLLLSDPNRAEEVVQEAFLRTFTRWPGLRDPARADAYVCRAVVNLCRSRLRRRTVERAGNEVVWHRAQSGERAAPAGAGDAALVVLDALRALPPRQREAIVLHYFADLSGPDVADAMGCSVGTVKSQLAKAGAALARMLGEEVRGG